MANDNGARPACFSSTITEVLFVLTTTMTIAMSSFLTGTVTVISSFIGTDLNMTTAEITWITSANTLAAGAFLLFFGRLSDMFGQKMQFILSLFAFSVVALGAGFSQNAITMDVLNGVLGLMSAAAVPPAMGSLGRAYDKPSKRKNYAFACFSAGNPLGFVFGTIASGVAADIFSWRSSFYLTAIIYLLITIVAIFTVPADQTRKIPWSLDAFKRFDIPGVLLTVSGIGLFAAALTLGGDAPQGWQTPYVLVLLILGILLIAGFIVWETYFAHNPIVPMRIFRDRDFSLLNIIQGLGAVGFAPAFFWMTLYIQRFYTGNALHVALYTLPAAVMGIIINIIAGLILHKVSNKLLMGVGALAYTIAFLLFALNRSTDSYWPFLFPGFAISVIGADFEFNVVNMYVMSTFDKHDSSVAGGIFQTLLRFQYTLGFGITTAIFNAVSSSPPQSGYYAGDPAAPYSSAMWFSTAACGLSVLLIPFLKIKTQGNEIEEKEEVESVEDVAAVDGGVHELEKDTSDEKA